MEGEVGKLRGWYLEERYRQRAPAYLGRHVRKVRPLAPQEVAQLLDEALDRGAIDEDDRAEALLADVVVEGELKEKGKVILVFEVSGAVGEEDVFRASERAAIFEKALGLPVFGVVAGEILPEEVERKAHKHGLGCLTDGRLTRPQGA